MKLGDSKGIKGVRALYILVNYAATEPVLPNYQMWSKHLKKNRSFGAHKIFLQGVINLRQWESPFLFITCHLNLSWRRNYFKRYRSYGVHKIFLLNFTWGNNEEIKEVRVITLLCDTTTQAALYTYRNSISLFHKVFELWSNPCKSRDD